MKDELGRELTTLEYIILGLLSSGPQTGYSIIVTLERATNRWSGSPGAIYPALKRLERHGLISSEVEPVYKARPRRLYHLLAFGEELLDRWLRTPLTANEILEMRDLTRLKFLFLEHRISREEVLTWLDAHNNAVQNDANRYRQWFEAQMPAFPEHRQLYIEASMMELNALRAWLTTARERLRAEALASPVTVAISTS